MKKRILVIEDNEQNMYLTTYLLENSGYEIVQAWNGEEGLKIAHELFPDLILLDIQLPVMDGYAVARALRQNEKLSDLPIIAVTSHAMTGDKEASIEAGCTAYIKKPIDPTTFVQEVELLLTSRKDEGVS